MDDVSDLRLILALALQISMTWALQAHGGQSDTEERIFESLGSPHTRIAYVMEAGRVSEAKRLHWQARHTLI